MNLMFVVVIYSSAKAVCTVRLNQLDYWVDGRVIIWSRSFVSRLDLRTVCC